MGRLADQDFCKSVGNYGTGGDKLVTKSELGNYNCQLKSGTYKDNQCVQESDIMSKPSEEYGFYIKQVINETSYDFTGIVLILIQPQSWGPSPSVSISKLTSHSIAKDILSSKILDKGVELRPTGANSSGRAEAGSNSYYLRLNITGSAKSGDPASMSTIYIRIIGADKI